MQAYKQFEETEAETKLKWVRSIQVRSPDEGPVGRLELLVPMPLHTMHEGSAHPAAPLLVVLVPSPRLGLERSHKLTQNE